LRPILRLVAFQLSSSHHALRYQSGGGLRQDGTPLQSRPAAASFGYMRYVLTLLDGLAPQALVMILSLLGVLVAHALLLWRLLWYLLVLAGFANDPPFIDPTP